LIGSDHAPIIANAPAANHPKTAGKDFFAARAGSVIQA
jgi:hypothetical protein